MRKTGMQITIRDLIIVMAILGLFLANFTLRSRTKSSRTRVTIRVFNRTGENLSFLRYEWSTVARLVESYGVNSGSVAIAPGGSQSFRVDLPGPVDFTLSCTTPLGRLSGGPVRIDVGDGHPGPIDFVVRPTGIVARGAAGSGNRRSTERSVEE